MKHKNILLGSAIGSGLLAATAAGYYAFSKKLFDDALIGKTKSNTIHDTNYSAFEQKNTPAIEWFENQEKQAVTVQTFDDLTLHGYTMKHPNTNHWVILVHGYKSNMNSMCYALKNFYEAGYNVLVFDQRAHGTSEGTFIGMGWLEQHDVIHWAYSLIKEDKDCKIAIYGVSMGGATVMMTTGNDLPSQIVCAIEDCGYTSVGEMFEDQARRKYKVSSKAMFFGVDQLCKKNLNYSFYQASCIDQVSKSKTPTLFIHGTHDTFVPIEMAYQCYEACSAPKQLFVAHHQEHACACVDKDYFSTATKFIETYM